MREYRPVPSNHRSRKTLRDYLEEHGRIGVEGVDTRALTRRIRTAGAMRGIVAVGDETVPELLEQVRSYPGLVGRNLVSEVGCLTPRVWKHGELYDCGGLPSVKTGPRVVVLDCVTKHSILRCLEQIGYEVVLVPSSFGPGEILALCPDGVLLSNGPGDPAPLERETRTVRQLLGKVPIFGICLGHQVLSQALGARTGKLKFGHHGVNQPVKNLATGRVEITSQNHGFHVLADTLPPEALVTHVNLNDGTLEGIRCQGLDALSVQYHPEAAPGPHDAHYLFAEFGGMMRARAGRSCGVH